MILAFPVNKEALPQNCGTERTERAFEEWQDQIGRIEEKSLKAELESFAASDDGQVLLTAVFAHSPYLTRCITGDMDFFHQLLKTGAEKSLQGIRDHLQHTVARSTERPFVASELRRAKKRASLAIGLADITRAWGDKSVVEALSDFAETALSAAVSHLLLEQEKRGALALANPDSPEQDCGYVVLAMGKLGARELNYSSDIDLIILFDPDKASYLHDRGPQEGYVRISRDLVRCIDDRTRDGYVFRTDLRLRPDPGATPIALSFNAAMSYYESIGQNWERAAMIKARPVAGDRALGQRFIGELRPFIWRKHLDFAAINDIHAIKRQIYAHKGGESIAVKGHNIKLGRGGIREIEFFAQTQQLIWGGRDPELRASSTIAALKQLEEAKLIAAQALEDMQEAYWFLRRLENRLQMTEDQQTQTLPDSDEGLAALAAFMGYGTAEAFQAELLNHLHKVEHHYARLFEDELDQPSRTKNLIFTGNEATPELLQTLQEIGFKDAALVFHLVTSWKSGRYRSVRSNRSRHLIAEIVPNLLEAFSRSTNPDGALMKFDDFLAGLPTGVQLFSMLQANPNLLDLLAEIMGSAPALADRLSQSPGLLDAVLTEGFFDPLPAPSTLEASLDEALQQARDFQDVLDISRRWTNDHRFQVGVQILRGTSTVEHIGQDLTNIADTVLKAMLPPVQTELSRRHGVVEGAELAILGMGKLGSREMTITSDLDLICLYEMPEDGRESNGDRPLDPTQYFARLTQRFTNALSTLTPEGRLYEIDMRLRPSGNAGPLATTLRAFERYQRNDAWTWEHMALTRARVVTAPADMRDKIEATIRDILCAPRDPAKLVKDVADMRERIARDKPASGFWDLKLVRGGIIDLEFLAQYLQLRHAHDCPAVLSPNTQEAFEKLQAKGKLDAGDAELLIEAFDLFLKLQNLLRLTVGGVLDEKAASQAVLARLAAATGEPSFDKLRSRVLDTTERVQEIFERTIGKPAKKAP